MYIGDQVRPVDTYDYSLGTGPKDATDIGEVINFDEYGDPVVKWSKSGRTCDDHVRRGSKFDRVYPHDFRMFGVVRAS